MFFGNGVEKVGILFYTLHRESKAFGKCYKPMFSLSLSPLQALIRSLMFNCTASLEITVWSEGKGKGRGKFTSVAFQFSQVAFRRSQQIILLFAPGLVYN